MKRSSKLRLAVASVALALPGFAGAAIVNTVAENTYLQPALLNGWTSNHQTDQDNNLQVADRWELPNGNGGLLSLGIDAKNWTSVTIYYGTAAGYESTGALHPIPFGPSNNNFNGLEFSLLNALIPQNNATPYNYIWFIGTSNGSGGDGYKGVGSVDLAPVPEPSTWAMLLAGLGMLGFMARRRAKQA